jgi:hypothetical protein
MVSGTVHIVGLVMFGSVLVLALLIYSVPCLAIDLSVRLLLYLDCFFPFVVGAFYFDGEFQR